MIREENQCLGCRDIRGWCEGDSCKNRHYKVYICDKCGTEDVSELYEWEGQELCEECFDEVVDDFKREHRIAD